MAQPIETIAGRDGLLLPVGSTRPIGNGSFSQFFQDINQLNDLGLYEGNEIYIPPVVVPDSALLRPALILRYAREPLPAQQVDRNRYNARPGPSDWGRYRPYTTGHDRISVMEMPKHTGAITELVGVRRELLSQEVITGLPSRRSQLPVVVYWKGETIDSQLTAREERLSYLAGHTSALSRFFKKTVKLFVA